MAHDRPLPPPRPQTARYAGWSERELLVRSIERGDEAFEHAARAHTKVDTLKREHEVLEIRVEAVEQRVTAQETRHPYRNPEDSWHEYDEDFERVRLEARSLVKDPKRPGLTSDRVRSIAKKALDELQEDAELDTWRRVKKFAGRIGWEAAKVALPTLLGALAYHLWRLLHP